DVIFLGYAVTIEFDVKVVTKKIQPPPECLFGLPFAYVKDEVRDFTVKITGGCDQAFAIFADQRLVVPWIDAIQPFCEAKRTQACQVVVPFLVACEQYLRIALVAIVFRELQLEPFFWHKSLAADDGFDLLVQRFPYKLECTVR